MKYSSSQTSWSHRAVHAAPTSSIFCIAKSRLNYIMRTLALCALVICTSLAVSLTMPQAFADFPHYAAGVTSSDKTGVVDTSTKLAWTHELKSASDWSTNATESLIVGDRLVMAVGDTLCQVNSADGTTVSQAKLSAPVGYNSRLAYADGIIVVLLDKGVVEAHDATTLKRLWVSAADEMAGIEATSTPLISDGKVFVASAVTSWSGSSPAGVLAAFDINSGKRLWRVADDSIGYKWAGAASINGVLVIGNDGGALSSYDAKSGEKLSTLTVSAQGSINSTIQVYNGTNAVFSAKTSDGAAYLYKVQVGADGSLKKTGEVKFGTYSTSTPAIVGNTAYVGGTGSDSYMTSWGSRAYYGQIAAVDLTTMNLVWKTSKLADGSWIPADVKSAPLVLTSGEDTWVYFTSNEKPGALYGYHVSESKAYALYTPTEALQNYGLVSPIADDAGNVYYHNDAGTLFKLSATPPKPVEDDNGEEGGKIEQDSKVDPKVDSDSKDNSDSKGDPGSQGDPKGDSKDGLTPHGSTGAGSNSLTLSTATSVFETPTTAEQAREMNKPKESKASDTSNEKAEKTAQSMSTSDATVEHKSDTPAFDESGLSATSIAAGVGIILGIMVLIGLIIAAVRNRNK